MTSGGGAVARWRPDPVTGWAALAAAARDLSGAVRVLVLRLDAPGWPASVPDGAPDDAAVHAVLRHLASPDLMCVAVLAGDVQPSCLRLALACDLRVASGDTRLLWGDPQHGWMSPVGLASLVDLVGRSRAAALVLAGDTLTAAEALQAGLVHRVCAPSELDRTVEDTVATLLARPRAEAAELKALLLASDRGPGAEWDAAERLRLDREGVLAEEERAD